MTDTQRPTKERIREHMQARAKSKEPPPTPDRIREELGWKLIPENGSKR